MTIKIIIFALLFMFVNYQHTTLFAMEEQPPKNLDQAPSELTKEAPSRSLQTVIVMSRRDNLAYSLEKLGTSGLEKIRTITSSGTDMKVSSERIVTALREIAPLCPNIKKLNLSITSVTDSGLQEIARIFPTLQSLCLIYCKCVTDAGIQRVVSALPMLQNINLECASVSLNCIEELLQQRPNLQIKHRLR